MVILFCSEPFEPRQVDSCFEAEAQAARRAGFEVALCNYERLVRGESPFGLRGVHLHQSAWTLYRGWMLSPNDYDRLATASRERGMRFVQDARAYRAGHHLPESYAALEGHTARTVWVAAHHDGLEERVREVLSGFGSTPVVVKDYVKSEKHHWEEACYIPDASDLARAMEVTRRFLELRGDALEGGLVYREFLELRSAGHHAVSGMPQYEEYRVFLYDGDVLAVTPYWDGQSAAHVDEVPLAWCKRLASKVPSRFLAMDVARRSDGEWVVMELGDGQVSGLPDAMDVQRFYDDLMTLSQRTP